MKEEVYIIKEVYGFKKSIAIKNILLANEAKGARASIYLCHNVFCEYVMKEDLDCLDVCVFSCLMLYSMFILPFPSR